MQRIVSYKSHTLYISSTTNSCYTRITNIVNGDTYQEIVFKAIEAGYKTDTRFVYQERIFLNGFLKSVVGFHNKQEKYRNYPFITFNDEAEYYVFCIVNDIPFEEQVWFKTTFIRTSIYLASIYIINASIDFLRFFHPEYIEPHVDYFDEYIQRLATKIQESQVEYKCDPKQHVNFLKEHHITCLYHFTSTNNVESIKANGLLSLEQLRNANLRPSFASSSTSRNIDKNKDLSDYVHLSYERDNPMIYVAIAEGRLSEYVLLEISCDVLFWKNTKYTNKNAAKSDAIITDDINFLLNIPFSKFHNKSYLKLREEDKEWFKSEILVKSQIPRKFINYGL
jgi:hypothetical protein